jgi:NADH dehydrogenase FAD-containing subunit
VIVGAGPAGVELAGELTAATRQFHRDVRRIDTHLARIVVVEAGPEVIAHFARPLREHAGQKLAELGVELRLGTRAVSVDDGGIDVEADGGKEQTAAGTMVWAAGVVGKPAWAFVHLSFPVGRGNRAGVPARWAYELGTRNRPERVVLEGVGADGAWDRLALDADPAPR